MKLTDRDITSILKVLTAKELLRKYIERKIILSKEQLNRLVFIKNQNEKELEVEKKDVMIDKYIEVLEMIKEVS